MTNRILGIVALLWGCFSHAQIVINELDADTPSTDVKEFVELKSTSANMPLDGYCLVFFNGGSGTSNVSYLAIDLDGMVTDVNGILLIGNSQVTPAPAYVIPNTSIQNGPDVVAIYQANASDFPLNTAATTTGLINALAYSNAATTTPSAIMTALGLTVCVNESLNQNAANQSMQRNNDGTFSVTTPTPGMNNDGSGIILNGITITATPAPITEGQTLSVTFTTASPVSGSALNVSFTMNNGSFTLSDYSGTSSISIPVGSSSATTNLLIVDDTNNEGDEELKIKVNSVPSGYVLNNNSIVVRVNDNDYIVSPWGTPLNPTYGIVTPTIPSGYYDSLEGLSGAALKQALQDIIANPNVVHAHNYGDIADILLEADRNPLNGSQIWMMYVESPRSKIDYQTGNSNIGVWNREHIWPQSRGGFADATSSIPDGINVWLPTGPDDIIAGHADAHHLRAEDGSENTTRSNRDYGSDYNGPAGNSGSWKGDVSRALFYMAVRYNGLNLVNGNPVDTTVGQMGDLASLLTWNHTDPADDFEMHRNNYIYTWQYNRNPFIDYPLLADYIFGSHFGEPWSFALQQNTFDSQAVKVYPNPATDRITIQGITQTAQISICDVAGKEVYTNTIQNDQAIDFSGFQSGIYIVKILSDSQNKAFKIVKQ
ncbi:endonuclease [Flavobacterium stagni]|uniref:T9SS type A sorting domain-containing protein n=1 Tax=Flavobacterium stagni TaxID=2506421 RepID=A0A4Q1K3S0_9FLAO|nr:endonuclease [Flavobacterium stagni]RXR19449.1 T9SS type A sorting domain-containing protein [Flavobacterium stagni]